MPDAPVFGVYASVADGATVVTVAVGRSDRNSAAGDGETVAIQYPSAGYSFSDGESGRFAGAIGATASQPSSADAEAVASAPTPAPNRQGNTGADRTGCLQQVTAAEHHSSNHGSDSKVLEAQLAAVLRPLLTRGRAYFLRSVDAAAEAYSSPLSILFQQEALALLQAAYGKDQVSEHMRQDAESNGKKEQEKRYAASIQSR